MSCRREGRPPSSSGRAASRALVPAPVPAARCTTCGAWAPSPRPATAWRCCSTPTRRSTKEALAGLERITERPTADYAAVAASQPHPQTLRGLGKAGVSADQLAATSFVGEIGNLGAASVGVALAMGLDTAGPGDHVLALGYGAGEAIAQDIEVTAAVPATATAGQVPGEAISVSTYYRWTRGRQAEPH